MLKVAGWRVQESIDADFAAGSGVAIREFMTPKGPVDYALVAERKFVGSVEAKKEGATLRQVEVQADRYADGFDELIKTRNLPRYHDRLPFHYISTGTETLFTSRRDHIRRPREVFQFHRPETLAAWAVEPTPYREWLRQLPPVSAAGLRDVQAEAITAVAVRQRLGRPRRRIVEQEQAREPLGPHQPIAVRGTRTRTMAPGGGRRPVELFAVRGPALRGVGRWLHRTAQPQATPPRRRASRS